MSKLVNVNVLVSLSYLPLLCFAFSLSGLDGGLAFLTSPLHLLAGATAGILVSVLAKFCKHKTLLSLAATIVPLSINLIYVPLISSQSASFPWYVLAVIFILHFFFTYRVLGKLFSSIRVFETTSLGKDPVIVKMEAKDAAGLKDETGLNNNSIVIASATVGIIYVILLFSIPHTENFLGLKYPESVTYIYALILGCPFFVIVSSITGCIVSKCYRNNVGLVRLLAISIVLPLAFSISGFLVMEISSPVFYGFICITLIVLHTSATLLGIRVERRKRSHNARILLELNANHE